MDFLCSLKQRSCARPPAILSGSSLPLSGPAAPQPPDPRMAAMEAEQAVLQGCQQVHGAVPMAQSTGSTTPQGPECHRDRQQQEQEQIAKSASQHGAGKPKQSLTATPSHRLPAAPASTSHLQGLSSQSCYLQPSQYPTRPKFSLFSTYVPRNKVSTGNAKDNRSTCLETEWMERELHTDPSKARPGQDKGSMPEQLFTDGWCS